MIIVVTGYRYWKHEGVIRAALELISPPDRGSVLRHGACGWEIGPHGAWIKTGPIKGADGIADRIGREYGWTVEAWPANWRKHGRGGGPERNREMLDADPPPDLVLAFTRDLFGSKGTRDCVFKANRRGIPVVLYGETPLIRPELHLELIGHR